MKVLVNGSGGFIDGYLCQALAGFDHDGIGTYRNESSSLTDDLPNVRLKRLDLAERLNDVEPVDAIVHAAAHTIFVPGISRDYVRSNVNGTLSLAEDANKIRPKVVVYLSTTSTYGEVLVSQFTDETLSFACNMYGLTKHLRVLILHEKSNDFPTDSGKRAKRSGMASSNHSIQLLVLTTQ